MQFTLPDLIPLCPFPWATSPHYKKAGAESAAWIDSYNIFSNRKRAFFVQSSNELLVSHVYSYAGYEEFRTCCDFVNLLFVVDEISDDQSGSGARETGDSFLRAMLDTACDGSVLSQITKQFKERFVSKAGPNTRRRFMGHCVKYIEAVTKEAELREAAEVLDLRSYETLRRENSAVRLCFGLFEYILGIDLPDETFEDPLFMRIYWAAADMVCWSNDVYSYNMEQAKGHTGNNYVTVVMQAMDLNLQEASDYIGFIFCSLMKEFLEGKSQLRSRSLHPDAAVNAYISALEHWVIGNLIWSFESRRYFGMEHYDVKATRVVTLKSREAEIKI
ncbi:terpenoid synthase [Rickenella mellea]|uniref:Terpene synthase n=1 Tax=Rickenella mellea TaxID=50990 RepID=A0A4Y7QD40_9AGAM|nr:terpenoid synthase [Rickenella mellea]